MATEITPNKTRVWRLAGDPHRVGGPAIEFSDGSKDWSHGLRHREDGPACEEADGTKAWYSHGKLHRHGGPAIEWPDGEKSWYERGCHVKGAQSLTAGYASSAWGTRLAPRRDLEFR